MSKLDDQVARYNNLRRHDPWDTITLHRIFRDPWERRVTRTKPADTRDVRSTGDYPEPAAMYGLEQRFSRSHRQQWPGHIPISTDFNPWPRVSIINGGAVRDWAGTKGTRGRG
jgi:hypothetical protein